MSDTIANSQAATDVGGLAGVLVAVVQLARKDARRGDERAARWVRDVAPWVLAMVFDDLDVHYIDAYLRRTETTFEVVKHPNPAPKSVAPRTRKKAA